MKQSQFYYLLRRGLLKGASIVKEGLVMFNKFTTAGISHPAQGSAYFDDSINRYIDIGSINIKDDLGITNALTCNFWLYNIEDGVYDPIFAIYGSAARIFWFGTNSNEGIHYNINTTSNNLVRNIANTEVSNEWKFISVTYDGANVKAYQNGHLHSTDALTGNIVDQASATNFTGELYIGKQPGSTNRINGYVANVSIYNRALNSDEINAIMWKSYDSLEASEKNGLQAWYRLDDISGTSVPDSSGNGNNGTAN